ncbi:MAG: bifunctional (p)ppGpp synthetase/guanosine-3',5'-bis(diphosphate) 3'-pyrophosphohydrolase [Nitrospinota bacterium]|nr:bifunctional (p)ppGpp synthetase/guanosine-3',5'-bis(diphosphate) 3'-pyrophosphohydrolase [Nitrospinota bacterium]
MEPILKNRVPARILDITEMVTEYAPGYEKFINEAFLFTANFHTGQFRSSGQPYISHPLEVGLMLAEMRQDPETIAAGLLHDTLEDTRATKNEINESFGEITANLVDGVTKLNRLDVPNTRTRQAENYRKMLVAMSDDIRVIIIKLIDRLHNAMTLEYLPNEAKKRIALETQEVYAPLANRLGIGWLKEALEDISFKHLYPDENKNIEKLLNEGLNDIEIYLEDVKLEIEKEMSRNGIKGNLSSRFKLNSSIFRKMKSQNLDFHQVFDICGIRIIVENTMDCYAVFGLLHSKWKPIPGRFRDYIALPKSNLYQSLHTTVIAFNGQRVEFQIRTKEMDQTANEGLAAHWQYKEHRDLDKDTFDKFKWLRQIMENMNEETDPGSLLDSFKVNLFEDEVFVFTPRGDVKNFPKGSSALDFAFAIHSELGIHCVGAKINGRVASITKKLENGDIVEITSNENRTPSPEWLNSVLTPKAKQEIKNWLRQQQKIRSTLLGRELLHHDLKRIDQEIEIPIDDEKLLPISVMMGFKTIEDLLAAIGFGKLMSKEVMQHLLPENLIDDFEKRENSRIRRFIRRITKRSNTGIKIKGHDEKLIRFAKCCDPIPGDPVMGFITQGKGVSIHARDCENIGQILNQDEQLLEVDWDENESKELHPVPLSIESKNEPGVLAEISSSIAQCNANIAWLSAKTNKQIAGIQLEVQVYDLKHLTQVTKSIKNLKTIKSVNRLHPSIARNTKYYENET